MNDKANQALAAAWASIDGKDINDPEYTDGYLSDSAKMTARLKSRGYVVVPIVPTKYMLDEAYDVFKVDDETFAEIYKAMIKAAGGKE